MSTISSSTTSTTAYKVTADTTGTLVIQTGATPTTALTVGTDQNVTMAAYLNAPNTFGFKNRIINGAMVIDQRNAGASVTPNNSYTLDRWQATNTQTGKYTVQQNAGSVTPPTGFTNYLGVTSSSAYSVTVSDYFFIAQLIEGFNVGDLGWGTANAQTVTLSFWVRSSLTGTFGGGFVNSDGSRAYAFSYTINSANTWEQKTITVVGDTTGTWQKTNLAGITIRFSLGAGSNFTTTAGVWQGTINAVQSTGATSVVGTNGATFYITGVQLEKGSTATSFDYRPYGTEFALCQRYYQTSTAYCYLGAKTSANTGWNFSNLPVAMRVAGTGAIISTGSTIGANWTIDSITSSSIAFGNTSTGEQRQSIVYSLSSEL